MDSSSTTAASPLWREPAFRTTLSVCGAAALLPWLVGGAPAGLVLLALLGAAYVGVAQGTASRLLHAAGFAAVAGVLPMLAGRALDANGLAPEPDSLGWLAAAGAMLSIPAIAALEAAPPPEVQAPGVATGRMPLLAGAAFSLALGLGAPAGIGFVLGSGALVGVAALVGGALLGRLRFRSFQAPRAAAAALILASGGGMVAVGLAWF